MAQFHTASQLFARRGVSSVNGRREPTKNDQTRGQTSSTRIGAQKIRKTAAFLSTMASWLWSRFDLAEVPTVVRLLGETMAEEFRRARQVRQECSMRACRAGINANAANNAERNKSTSLGRRGREAGAGCGEKCFWGGSLLQDYRQREESTTAGPGEGCAAEIQDSQAHSFICWRDERRERRSGVCRRRSRVVTSLRFVR